MHGGILLFKAVLRDKATGKGVFFNPRSCFAKYVFEKENFFTLKDKTWTCCMGFSEKLSVSRGIQHHCYCL